MSVLLRRGYFGTKSSHLFNLYCTFILYCVDLKPHNAGPFDTDNVLLDTENATENATVFIIPIFRYTFFYNQSGC